MALHKNDYVGWANFFVGFFLCHRENPFDFVKPFIGVIYTPFITIGLGPTWDIIKTKDKFGASQLTRESKTPKNSVSKVRQLSKKKVKEEEFPRKI